ncbi:hypothetical protein ACLOJK_022817 [Asimina triloba]
MESQEEDFIQDMLPAPDQMEEPAAAAAGGNDNGKLRLIFDKGWRIGKKIAITGVAISTAPILLLPLFIFSVFSLAFSVPFGLVFAGYVCTDKIMCFLLLPPPPPQDAVATVAPSEEELSQLLEMKDEDDGDGDVPLAPEYHYYEIEEPATKVDDVHVTEIYEEDVREITEDDERRRRLELGGPPKNDREQDFKVELEKQENGKGIARPDQYTTGVFDVGDVDREAKGQQGEEITKDDDNDDRSRLVVGEMRKADDYKIKQDVAGEKEMGEVQQRDDNNKMKHDVGVIKKEEEKEIKGRPVSGKQFSETDDFGVPSVLIVSTLKEETGIPKPYTPGTEDIDVGTYSYDVRQLGKSSDPGSRMRNLQDSSILVPAKVTPLDDKSLDHDMGSAEHSETLSKPESRAASGKQQLESPTVEVSSLVSVNTCFDYEDQSV